MIQLLQQNDPAAMREVCDYLASAPAEAGACQEHDPRWLAVLKQGLGHEPRVLVHRDGQSRIDGYLPLALVASRLFGRFLVSLPYLNRGGVVAVDPAVAAALVDRAVELAAQTNVNYLELRHGRPLEHVQLPARRDEKFRMVLALPDSAETLWKGLDAKVRNQVRKGDKSDLAIRWGGRELLHDFYDVFAVNMRDLGTPVYSRGLFASILEQFGDQAELAVVDYQKRPVACAMLVHDQPLCDGQPRPGGSTQVPSASSLREFNQTNANMWMYHRLLLRSIERRCREFDFGRSSEGSGTYRFKKQWGAQPEPTVWQYHVRRGDIGAVRPDSPRYQRRIAVWQRLPVWITRLIGPPIVRGIP